MQKIEGARSPRALGIRCEPNRLHYATLTHDGEQYVLETSSIHKYPGALPEASMLSRLVQEVNDLVQHHKVDRVGIKSVEPSAGRLGMSAGLVRRIHSEGAILAKLGELGVPAELLVSNTIKSRLDVMRPLKQYVNSPDFSSLPVLASVSNKTTREAILAGLAVIDAP